MQTKSSDFLPSSSFISMIMDRQTVLRDLPLQTRSGEDWQALAITLSPPAGSDIVSGLDIEELDGEVTINFDYAHVHLEWPSVPRQINLIWWDAEALVDAILSEKVVAYSGWIDGQLRIGALSEADTVPDLIVPNLEYIRVRSWLGKFDRDERF